MEHNGTDSVSPYSLITGAEVSLENSTTPSVAALCFKRKVKCRTFVFLIVICCLVTTLTMALCVVARKLNYTRKHEEDIQDSAGKPVHNRHTGGCGYPHSYSDESCAEFDTQQTAMYSRHRRNVHG